MIMQRVLLGLTTVVFVAPVAPLTSVAQTPAPAEPVVTTVPDRPVQGHLFMVHVRGAGQPFTDVEGQVADQPLHFELSPDGSWRSLAAVPIDHTGDLTMSLTVRDGDGTPRPVERTITVSEGNYRHERLTVSPRMGSPLNAEDQARLARDQERARDVSNAANRTPRLWTDRVILPRRDRVTSGFGNGRVFNDQVSSRHMGLDLDGEPGDTVYATTRGVVALVDEFLLAGNIVYLNHGGGLLSGYFHLSEQLVVEGDTVQAGTPIGRVGATGRVTGPHLHWVVRYGTVSVDPRSLPGLAEQPPSGR